MTSDIQLRMARAEDAPTLLVIFTPYVLQTAVAFNYEPPTLEEFRSTMTDRLRRYPYLVAQRGEELIGYAYASPFKQRAAYDWAVETSIYVKQSQTGTGCGRKLYETLEKILKAQHILSMYACIAYTDTPDEHLSNNSPEFHAHMGFELTAKFPKCGYKFNKWYDMIWMHKEIGSHTDAPLPVIPVTELDVDSLL